MSELMDAMVEGTEQFVFFKKKEEAHAFARAIKDCDGKLRFGEMSFECDDGFAFTADIRYKTLDADTIWRVRVGVKPDADGKGSDV